MDDLSVLIRSASGYTLTLSTTADNPDELVTVESITTKHGTGFETAVLTLHRDPKERFDDLHLLMEVIITDSEGFVLHEGLITGLPPETGKLKINSTGKYSLLRNKTGFSEIYSDKDVSRWGGTPLNRRAELIATYSPADGQVVGASILTELSQPTWTAGALPNTEMWYTAPAGVGIGNITAAWQQSDEDINFADFIWAAYLSGDDAPATSGDFDSSGDLQAAGPGTVSLNATASNRRFASLQLLYGAAYGVDDSFKRGILWTPTVTGNHGLTSITASTVLKNFIDRYAPGLTYDDESITDHPYEIGQLVFEGVDGTEVFAKVNSFANWNCHVWEGGRVWFGPQPDLNAPHVILDIDDGDELDPDGQSVSTDYPVNGVEGFYNDVLTQRDERVGPDDDDRLVDTSDENPCNKENMDRWGNLDITFPATEDDVIQILSVWLAEHLIPSRSGSGKAVGMVTAADGQQIPARRLRAGDVIRFRHESIGREIYETTYQPITGEVALKFDDGVATLTAMLERIGVAIMLVGGR